MANRKVEIDDKTRKQVEQLAGLGLKDDQIALVVDLKEATMQRRCRKELDKGRAVARATIAKTAFSMGTSGECPSMTMFLCKTQLGWRETQRVEFPDKNGEPQDLPQTGVVFFMPDNGRDPIE